MCSISVHLVVWWEGTVGLPSLFEIILDKFIPPPGCHYMKEFWIQVYQGTVHTVFGFISKSEVATARKKNRGKMGEVGKLESGLKEAAKSVARIHFVGNIILYMRHIFT